MTRARVNVSGFEAALSWHCLGSRHHKTTIWKLYEIKYLSFTMLLGINLNITKIAENVKIQLGGSTGPSGQPDLCGLLNVPKALTWSSVFN